MAETEYVLRQTYFTQFSTYAGYVNDTFNRVTANGWGLAPTGTAWQLSAGTASFFSTQVAFGIIAVGSAAVSTIEAQLQPVNAGNPDIVATLATNLSAAPVGNPINWIIDGRWQAVNQTYRLLVSITQTDTVQLSIQRITPSGGTVTLTSIVTIPGITSAHNTTLGVHFQINGTQLQAKAWDATGGGGEPSTWNVTAVDSLITGPGSVRVGGFRTTGNTDTTSQLWIFDIVITPTGGAIAAVTQQIGPTAAFTRWQLTRYTINVLVQKPPNYPVGSFILYRGDPAQGNQLDYTQQVLGDTSDGNDVELHIGDYVTGVWSITTPAPDYLNVQCQITFDGKIFVKGKRSY